MQLEVLSPFESNLTSLEKFLKFSGFSKFEE